MIFTVIFTTKSRTTFTPTQNVIDQLRKSLEVSSFQYQTEEQEPQDIGLDILDRYRKDINDEDVTIEDLPDLIENRKDPTTIEINEDIARKSGHFEHRTRFKCWINPNIMVKFEKIENVSSDENEKMKIIVDEERLIDEWEKAGFPEEWVPQTKKKNEKE